MAATPQGNTPKQGMRIPQDRWLASQAIATSLGSDATKVVNALLVLLRAGRLAEVPRFRELARMTRGELAAAEAELLAAGAAHDGGGGQISQGNA